MDGCLIIHLEELCQIEFREHRDLQQVQGVWVAGIVPTTSTFPNQCLPCQDYSDTL